MSEAVSIQVIATVGLVVVAVLGLAVPFVAVAAQRLLRRVRAIQDQVENNHKDSETPNLRDDIDVKHTENRSILLTIQRDVAWIMRRQAETDQRLDTHIEQTEGKEHHVEPRAQRSPDPRGVSGLTRRDLRARSIYGPPGGTDGVHP